MDTKTMYRCPVCGFAREEGEIIRSGGQESAGTTDDIEGCIYDAD